MATAVRILIFLSAFMVAELWPSVESKPRCQPSKELNCVEEVYADMQAEVKAETRKRQPKCIQFSRFYGDRCTRICDCTFKGQKRIKTFPENAESCTGNCEKNCETDYKVDNTTCTKVCINCKDQNHPVNKE